MFGPVLIPAAGNSVRMGRPKLLLPLDGMTIIERVVSAARLGGVERTIVVVRPDDDELASMASRAGADVVKLPAPTPDMRATVLAGLEWIEVSGSPPPGFFLVPADHPALSPGIYRALQTEIARQRSTIVVPTFQGRRGHPVWIAWSHVAALRTIPPGRGLNEYLRAHQREATELPWPTPEILIDLDTPVDYEALLHIPTLITAAGESLLDPTHRPRAILPGSFNPVHAGHWGLAAAARDLLGVEIEFELSRRNVDKPELADDEIAQRANQFRGRADLWITRSPRFFEKADCFPGATFVLGADTAARLVDVRYYDGDAGLAAAFERLAELACRFLVAARVDAGGRLLTLGDLAMPTRWRELFDAIPETLFRLDVSSTDLRREDNP